LGQIFMTGILNVEAFSKVNLEIIQWPHAPVNMTVLCDMGKISGNSSWGHCRSIAERARRPDGGSSVLRQ